MKMILEYQKDRNLETKRGRERKMFYDIYQEIIEIIMEIKKFEFFEKY